MGRKTRAAGKISHRPVSRVTKLRSRGAFSPARRVPGREKAVHKRVDQQPRPAHRVPRPAKAVHRRVVEQPRFPAPTRCARGRVRGPRFAHVEPRFPHAPDARVQTRCGPMCKSRRTQIGPEDCWSIDQTPIWSFDHMRLGDIKRSFGMAVAQTPVSDCLTSTVNLRQLHDRRTVRPLPHLTPRYAHIVT